MARSLTRGVPVVIAVFILSHMVFPGVARAATTLAEADQRLAAGFRLLDSGLFTQASDIALKILNDPAFHESDSPTAEDLANSLARRETARFLLERSRFGLAESREEYLDVAEELAFLFQNRYRLANPVYSVQSAYWSGRSFQEAGDYDRAIAMYSRVGGSNLPEKMEGDAARRVSQCLRQQADLIPFPGTIETRRKRENLLNQAISELEQARNSFPIGDDRKQVELDLIGLRMSSRQLDYIREAQSDANIFLAGEAARNELRARAALYRAQAAAFLGETTTAIQYYQELLKEENPTPDDRRTAEISLALSFREMAENLPAEDRTGFLRQASETLGEAMALAGDGEEWDQAHMLWATLLLELKQPTAVLDAIAPLLKRDDPPARANYLAGRAEWELGHLEEAISHLEAATRPSGAAVRLRIDAARAAADVARYRGNPGLALTMRHQASRLFRQILDYGSLLGSEFSAMEEILGLGSASVRNTIPWDWMLGLSDSDVGGSDISERQAGAIQVLGKTLTNILQMGPEDLSPDSRRLANAAYELSVRMEELTNWSEAGSDGFTLVLGMISHLRSRQLTGQASLSNRELLSREGETYYGLAVILAGQIMTNDVLDQDGIRQVLANFDRSGDCYRESSGIGRSLTDTLALGMVNLASGGFLLHMADKWGSNEGSREGSSQADVWRQDGKQRISSSLRFFDFIIAGVGSASSLSLKARLSRSTALELLDEWDSAARGFAWLMNDSEVSSVLRLNAARHWANCQVKLGETARALDRLAVFSETDAETAFVAAQIAEESGNLALAWRLYLFAADPASPAAPPKRPGRLQDATYRAASLAIHHPKEVEPDQIPLELRHRARELLEQAVERGVSGDSAVGIFRELGESWIYESTEGWREAYRLLMREVEQTTGDDHLRRSLYLLASQALVAGGNLPGALEELDHASDLLPTELRPVDRRDAASITLAMADIFRLEERWDDALRAYAEVFATYPEEEELSEDSRLRAARLLLELPGSGAKEKEQAR
ncbi:MAG: tetratricopeptide repeat protein, partial [Planctomycetota bacterium]|nr:tetratricopeptide repeat protein [Planctomycetota bacterium]